MFPLLSATTLNDTVINIGPLEITDQSQQTGTTQSTVTMSRKLCFVPII